MLGMSFVNVVFEDGTDLYWARSRVLEYLAGVTGKLPRGVTPTLGPDATGVGWVFEYALVDPTGKHDLQELRALEDWNLRYALGSVPGVAEVASVGGFVKQYQVNVDPTKLLARRVTMDDVARAVRGSNDSVWGGSSESPVTRRSSARARTCIRPTTSRRRRCAPRLARPSASATWRASASDPSSAAGSPTSTAGARSPAGSS